MFVYIVYGGWTLTRPCNTHRARSTELLAKWWYPKTIIDYQAPKHPRRTLMAGSWVLAPGSWRRPRFPRTHSSSQAGAVSTLCARQPSPQLAPGSIVESLRGIVESLRGGTFQNPSKHGRCNRGSEIEVELPEGRSIMAATICIEPPRGLEGA